MKKILPVIIIAFACILVIPSFLIALKHFDLAIHPENGKFVYTKSEEQYMAGMLDIWLPDEMKMINCGYDSIDNIIIAQVAAGFYVNAAIMELFNNSYLKFTFSGDFYDEFMDKNMGNMEYRSYHDLSTTYKVISSQNVRSVSIAKSSTSYQKNASGYEIHMIIYTNSWEIKNIIRKKTWKATLGIK